jgi:acyl-CoA hydrolase
MEPKKFQDSEAILAQLVLPYQANTSGNVHGGEIMKLMDSTAGVSAMKYSGTNVVTARVDELCFKQPIHIGEHVMCRANVVFAGHSSMEVFVTVESEDLKKGEKQLALTAFFTMVALDENGRPTAVPPLEFSSEPYIQKLYIAGQNRYMKHRRKKQEVKNG